MPPVLPRLRCPHCAFTCPRNRDLQFHILFHAQRRYHKCPLCPKHFRTRANFKDHLSESHKFNPTVVHCFRSRTMSNNNAVTPYRPFHCHTCAHTFRSNQTLQNHVRTHTSEPVHDHTCPCHRHVFSARNNSVD